MSYCHLAQRAQFAVGVENACGIFWSGSEGDGDGIVRNGLLICLAGLLTKIEDQTFIFFNAVDVIGGGGLVITEEVVGFNEGLSFLFGLDLLGELLLVSSGKGRCWEKQENEN